MPANPKYPDRCPICGRALFNGECVQDGKVEGVKDLENDGREVV